MITKESLKRKNFAFDEFFVSEKAKELKIKNYPKQEQSVLACLMLVADKIQEVRNLLQYPIQINSAYRCLEVNRAVGSKDNSQHIQGQAIDFICPLFGTPKEIVRFLKENEVEVDQCIEESTWVHLSITHNKNRNQFASLIDGKFTII
jgi:uncharacterized protein YcbK (DUF882 family)